MKALLPPACVVLAITVGSVLLISSLAHLNMGWYEFAFHGPPEATQDQLERAADILRGRLALFGGEYHVISGTIDLRDDGRIVASLKTYKSKSDRLPEMLDKMARRAALELRLAVVPPDPPGRPPEGYELLYQTRLSFELDNIHNTIEEQVPFFVRIEPEMTCTSFRNVERYTTGMMALPSIRIEFHPADARRFADITAEHVGELLAIVFDDHVQSVPTIREQITEGVAIIENVGKRIEARPLSELLRLGALPFELTVEPLPRNAPAPEASL